MPRPDLIPLADVAEQLGLDRSYPALVRQLHPDLNVVHVQDSRDRCLYRPWVRRADLDALLEQETS
jgi:hypothetical protein